MAEPDYKALGFTQSLHINKKHDTSKEREVITLAALTIKDEALPTIHFYKDQQLPCYTIVDGYTLVISSREHVFYQETEVYMQKYGLERRLQHATR